MKEYIDSLTHGVGIGVCLKFWSLPIPKISVDGIKAYQASKPHTHYALTAVEHEPNKMLWRLLRVC